MTMKPRSALQQVFSKGKIPLESDFADLFDTMLSQSDDGIAKSSGDPLKIAAAGDEQVLINFYPPGGLGGNASWLIKQGKQGPGSGLSIREVAGTSPGLFIQSGTGNVGIGTITPGFPLTFPNSSGDKVSLWGQSGAHYGFGIADSLLRIHTDVAGSDVAFGYGSSSSFTETMRIKGTGNLEVAGTVTARGLVLGDPMPKQDQASTHQTKFTSGYSGFSNFNNNAEISNDISTSFGKALMLNGNSSRKLGGERWVQVWDNLEVVKNLFVGAQGNAGSVTVAGAMKIDGANTMEFGAGVDGKQEAAGKIGYQTWSGDSLDIVGAGTTNTNRKIKLWAEGGATITGPVTATKFIGDGSGLTMSNKVDTSGGTMTGSLTIKTEALSGIRLDHAGGKRFFRICLNKDGILLLIYENNQGQYMNPDTGNWHNNSDIRLKEDISGIPEVLEKAMQLKPVRFRWKANQSSGLGFIAQDVERVFPELVSTSTLPIGGGEEFKGLAYSSFGVIAIAALQELKTSLEQKVQALEQRVKELGGLACPG